MDTNGEGYINLRYINLKLRVYSILPSNFRKEREEFLTLNSTLNTPQIYDPTTKTK